ncbi:NAD(+) synthase [bacterium]|nr:NAD(+) synthase [bacterium]
MSLADEISQWIKTKVEEAKAKGVVVGLSGGLDSSVVAALVKKALGDNVLGLIMPCQSNPIDEEDALLVVSRLNLKIEKVSLDVTYSKLLETLPFGNKLALANLKPKLLETLPFGNKLALANLKPKLLETLPFGNKLALANLKPRLRMLILYYFANSLNYLVAGTGNKSEIMAGYFTKYGDGGVDILPIGGLLKTEVRALAKEFNLPKKVLEKAPTAGLWPEQTDEDELGLTYHDLDEILKRLESNEITNLPQKLVIKVKKLVEISQHKRMLPLVFKQDLS